MSEQVENLDMSVSENVKTIDKFGKDRVEKQLKGSAGTLHITSEENKEKVVDLAWQLSKQTQLPVVVVVRAPREV